ncbi:MAG: TatD family hydrolase, partial [Chloroflexota bacterium]
GPIDIFQALVARGFNFTIGVAVSYDPLIQTFAQELPADQLLTETDNPSALSWLTKDESLGMPRHIIDVVDKLADLRQTTPEAIQAQVMQNFKTLLPGRS